MQPYDDIIAYFSMEIGIREEIPTYSGGLGVLAGDTLKSFADIGMDAVAVTLLSEKGYFYQKIDPDGTQREEENGWPIEDYMKKLNATIEVKIQDRVITVGAWEYFITGVQGKRIRVLFLDTNNDQNTQEDRKLTSYLYGGDLNYRLKQEIILGIGGIRLLRKLGYNPKKFHMNEGHAAFLTLELYNELYKINEIETRIKKVKAKCSFTTHTPVPAGHDSFDETKIRDYLQKEIPPEILDMVLKDEKFSMTKLALCFSSYVNAVSKKHGEVTKAMFPEYDIDFITNGVHTITWTNPHLSSLLDKHVPDWKINPLELRNALRIPIEEIWETHQKAKKDLIEHVNIHTNAGFDTETFTIGFARRATGYKRAEILFSDINRLKKINNETGKLQIIFAGKAHPRDGEGKEIIKHIFSIINSLKSEVKIVFLENYNMHKAKLLTAGVDLWLNTPIRPLEASGTSGMKAAHNGVPSLSVPDGWWIEGLIENFTGWGIGPETILNKTTEKENKIDSEELYNKLEQKIVPMYYKNKKGYTKIMRNALAINGSYFNTHRMVKQYLVRAYARKQKE